MAQRHIGWDWRRRGPSQEELERALNPLGVLVYPNPNSEGSDYYGYILSNEPLSPEELQALADKD